MLKYQLLSYFFFLLVDVNGDNVSYQIYIETLEIKGENYELKSSFLSSLLNG